MKTFAAAARLAEQRVQILVAAHPRTDTDRAHLHRLCTAHAATRQRTSWPARTLSWVIGWDLDRIDRVTVQARIAETATRQTWTPR